MATITWQNNSDGTWATASDWSTGSRPGSADTAILNSPSAHTVTHDATTNDTVFSLIATTDTLAMTGGDLTIKSAATLGAGLTQNNGVLTFDAGSTIAGIAALTGGTIIVASSATLTAGGPVTLGGVVIEGPGKFATTGSTTINAASFLDVNLGWINSGTVTDGAQLNLDYPSQAGAVAITNTATGVFDITANGNAFDIYSTAATFTNAGVLAKTAGTGTTNIYAVVANTGTITASSGTLELDAAGALGGSIGATGTGALALGGAGTFTLAGTSLTIGGTLDLDGGTLSVTSNKTLNLTGAVGMTAGAIIIGSGATVAMSGSASLSGATIYIAKNGTLALSGPATFGTGLSIDGPGTLATSGSTTITATADLDGSLVWTNSGSVVDSALLYLEYPSATGTVAIVNQAGGTFDLTFDGNPFYNYSGVNTVTNAGLLEKTAITGTSNLSIAVPNTGTITASSGTIEFDAGEVLAGVIGATGTGALAFAAGTFSVGGATQTVSGALNLDGGVVTVGTSKTLSLTGSVSLSAGIIELAKAGTLALSGTDVLSGGTIIGPGTLETAGSTSFTATTYLDGSLTWLNTGTVTDAYQLYVSYPSYAGTIAIVNAAGGVFDLGVDGNPFYAPSGVQPTFANAGVLSRTGDTGITNLYVAVSNSGTITASSGTLELDSGGVLAGAIGATGTGALAFGGGTFTVGGQTQTVSGTLDLDGGTISVATGDTLTLTGNDTLYSGALVIAKTGTLALAGHDTLSSVIIYGPGELETTGTTSFGSAVYFGNSATWVNTGSVTDGVQLYFNYPNSSGSIAVTNALGGVFDVTVDGNPFYLYGGTTATFANAGLLTRTGDTNVTNFYAAVTNTGTITALSGTLELDSGGVLGGVIGATGTGALAFGSGTFTTGLLSQTVTGTLDLDGGTISVATGDTLTLTGNDTLYSGAIVIAKTGTLVLAGNDTLASIDIYGPGELETTGTTSLTTTDYFGNSATWVNTGSVTVAAQSYFNYPNATGSIAVTNAQGAVFDFAMDGNPFYLYGGTAATLTNAGVLTRTGDTNTTNLYVALTNSGTVTATSGVLELDAGGTLSGTIGATGTGAVALGSGTFTVGGTTQLITGGFEFDGGAVSIAAGKTLTLTGALAWSGSDVTGPGTLATSGTTTIGSTSNVAYIDGGLTWLNSGTVLDGYTIYDDAYMPSSTLANTFTNQAGGVFDITATGYSTFYNYTSAPNIFSNAGLLEQTAGAGASYLYAALNNTGTVTASSGILDLYNGGTLGGTIGATGTGEIAFGAGVFTLPGTMQTITGPVGLLGGTLDVTNGKTLTLSGAVNWSGTDVQGPGTLATTGTTTIGSNYGVAYIDGGLTWTNSGTVLDSYYTYDYGYLSASTLANTFTNQAGGVFDITATGYYTFYNYTSAPDIFNNAGLLEQTGGTGTETFYATLNNTGTVTASSGILDLYNGGTLGGSVTINAAGELAFGSGTFMVTGGLVNSGTLAVTGGSVGFASATQAIGGNVGLDGGAVTIASGKTLTLSGAVNWSGTDVQGPGTLATTGTTSIGSNYGVAYIDGGLTWTNSGTVLDSYYTYDGAYLPSSTLANTFANQAGGVFDITATGYYAFDDYSSAPDIFSNAGLLEQTAGTSTEDFYAALNNTGTVTASSGILQFQNGGTLGGTIGATGTGEIAFGAGVFTLLGTTQTITGPLEVIGGTLNIVIGKTLTLSGAVTWANGDVDGPGTLATTGTTTISNNTGAFIDGGLTWTNSGTVLDNFYILENDYTSSSTLATTFVNQASGTFDITAFSNYGYSSGYDAFYNYSSAPNLFTNAGLLEQTAGTGTSFVGATLTNTGTVTATHGTLDLYGGGTLNGTAGGTGTGGLWLDGNGGNFVTTGTLAILDAGATANDFRLVNGETLTDTGVIDDSGRFEIGNSVATTAVTIAAGASFDFTADDGSIVNGGGPSLTNLGTLAKITGTGTSTVGIGFSNSGTVDAASGTLKLAGGAGGTGRLQIEAGKTLELASGSIAGSNTIDLNGAGATLKIDTNSTVTKPIIGLGAGSRIDLAAASSATAVINGSTLTITSAGGTALNFVSTTSLAGLHATTASDGGTGTVVTLYAQAVAAPHAPEPVVFANAHIGGTATQTLTVANIATPVGYAENLDAGLSNATTGFTTSGTITGLAAGASNSTALTITESTTTAGTLTGTATLGLVSDGTGIDSAGTTALPSQTVTLHGAVYALAAPALSPTTINLGTIRTGGTFAAGTVTLSNGTTHSAYQEALTYAATGAPIATNASGTIASGGSAAIGLSLSTATSGAFTATPETIALTSTGIGTSGLANTVLNADTVTVNGTVYAPAIATLGTNTVNFGNVHVGATASQTVGITNTATGALTDILTGGTATNTGSIASEIFTLGTGLAAGASGTIKISANTTTAGTITGTATLGFTSHDSALADIAINGGTVSATGGVYALAAPILSATTVNLGAARVGGTLSPGTIILSDGTKASAYQESLLYTATGIATTNGTGTILAGGSASVGFIISTATAGNFNGTLGTLALTSTGLGTSGLANTTLASDKVTVNAQVYAPAIATLGTNSLNFGIIHVGAAETVTATVTNTVTGALTDVLTGGTATNTGSVSGVIFNIGTGLAAGASGSLQIAINTGTAGTVTGTTALGFSSHDTLLSDATINGGTITVTGTVDNYATAQVELTGGAGTLTQSGSAYTINLGNVDQGGTALVADLGVLNAASGPADQLGGTFAASGASQFTNTGLTAFGPLNAGQDERAQVVTLNTGTVGVFTETLLVTPYGTNASGYYGTLATETVTLTGTVDALAAPILSATTLNLGSVRVGGTLAAGTIVVSDGTAATALQESLIYAATAPNPITVTGGSGTIASGGTASVGFSLNTGTAGNFTGTQGTIALASTGAGTDGLPNTTLTPATVTLNGKVYAPAVAVLGTTSINLGIVHVGDTVNQTVAVTNIATGTLTDLLTAGTATLTGVAKSATVNLGTAGLAAAAAGSVVLGINTATAGTVTATAALGFTSHDSDLSDIAINGGTVAMTGTIDNYATAQIKQTGGVGTLTHTGNAYTLNLGTILLGGTALVADLAIANAAAGPADLLSGSFAATGTTGFANTGLTAFSGIAAGGLDQGIVVTLNTATGGTFTETITLAATGTNASGYKGTLTPETLTITGAISTTTGTTYVLTPAPVTIAGTPGNDVITAASNTLNSHDSINGSLGSNTLALTGGGYFDLGAPSLLSNIQIVTAQESTAGTNIYMRNGLNVTLNVAPAGTGTLLAYGGTDSDIYNLGAGSDTVVLGAATESVNATGGGTALIQATDPFASAAVIGGTTGTTTLEVTSGGNLTLNAADTNLTVTLDAKTNLTLGSLGFITAIGSTAGGETITAGAANQTLVSTGGSDTLAGFSGFGDTFQGTAAGFLGDTVKGFGGSDVIDFTDIAFGSVKTPTFAAGKLTVSDAAHSAILTLTGTYTTASFSAPIGDGHGGTEIKFI